MYKPSKQTTHKTHTNAKEKRNNSVFHKLYIQTDRKEFD